MRKLVAFVLLLMGFFTTSVYLRAKINNLTMNIQEKEWKIKELKEENRILQTEIQQLQTQESVIERLNDPDLYYNPDNIIVISN